MNYKDITLYEIKSLLKSKVFYAFVIVVLISLLTNYSSDSKRLEFPQEGDFYGFTYSDAEEDILYRGYELLSVSYMDREVIRYIPLASFKKLSDKESKELGEFLETMASGKKFYEVTKDDFKIDSATMFSFMEKFDQKLGGKTYFADKESFYTKKKSYEEEILERSKIKEQDEFSRAYARLFSDYNGINAALYTIFVVVFSLFRDSRTGQEDLYLSSNVSSHSYIGGKFLGLLLSIMGVFLLFSLIESIIFLISAIQNGESIDLLAFIWTSILWITPTVMFSVAFPILIHVLFRKISLTFSAQLFISCYMLFSTPLYGNYSLSRLIIRFNSLSPYENFAPYVSDISINRLFYVILSLSILKLATYIWDTKKKRTLEDVYL